MKTALITTTVHVPTVLQLYRKLDPSVAFFVAADLKTSPEAYELCASIPNCKIYSPDRQKELGYECSALLGWNNIGRRNIALLEALKWGADLIVMVDDDNIPMESTYFYNFKDAIYDILDPAVGGNWHGLAATSSTGWFDVGTLLDPVAPHRGFPHTEASPPIVEPVTDARIGVAAGICLGDPDISACTRIANAPTVHRVSEVLRSGVVTDPRETWTVFNSQNTAFIRELAPCFLMVPQFGRYDDIFASLVAQRVMRELNLHVHFGQPFVWQQRNQHDLLKDLRAEMWGQENILAFAEWLDAFVIGGDVSKPLWVVEAVHALYREIVYRKDWIPREVCDLEIAWMIDCERVMG